MDHARWRRLGGTVAGVLLLAACAHSGRTNQPASPPIPASSRPTSASKVVATVEISAEYRDDPRSANGLCGSRRVIPARWRVSLPSGSATVANAGRAAFPAYRSLITCAGQLDTPSPVISL